MKYFTLIIVLLFSTISYANPVQPEMCPSAGAIQATPFYIQKDFTTSDGRNFYIATQEDQKYDTTWKDVWHFEIYGIEATSVVDARQKLNSVLSSLSFKEGPKKMGNLGWDCFYNIDSGYKATAMADLIGGLHRFHINHK